MINAAASFVITFWVILSGHIFQRPLRTLLTVIGVALGVSASVAVRTANIDVLRSFEQAVLTVAGPTTLEVSGGEWGLDERIIAVIRKVPGVLSGSPVILQTAVVTKDGRQEAVQVLGLDLLAEIGSRGFRLTHQSSGREFETILNPNTILLGNELAAAWNVSVGETIDLQVGTGAITCTITGLLDGAQDRTALWSRLAVMDIAAAQMVFGMVGRLDRIDLVTDKEHDVEEVQRAVQAVVPPTVTVERPSSRTTQTDQMMRAFRLNVTVLSWVGLLVGMFLIYNTMAFAVAQRRREIGIYRAIGMTQARVAVLFWVEGALLGLVGGMIGSAAGFLLARELVVLLSRTISDLYVPVGAGAGGLQSAQLWRLAAEGTLLGCVVSMIGAVGPSVNAARTVPTRALAPGDYETSQQVRVGPLAIGGAGLLVTSGMLSLANPINGVPFFGYASTLCLLAGLSCLAPICVTTWRQGIRPPGNQTTIGGIMRAIAVDHASRNPGRNGVSISALMVGLSIMIGVLIMIKSFRNTVEVWVAETVMADVIVAPSLWLRGMEAGSTGRSLPAAWREILAGTPGVMAVDTYRDVRVTVRGKRVAIVSRDLRIHARLSRYWVRHGDSAEQLVLAADSDGVLVSEILADQLHVQEGDSLELMTPEGVRRFPVVAVFYDYATDGGKILMDRRLYQSLWHDDLVTVFPVYLEPKAQLDAVRQEMAARLKGAGGRLPPLLISNAELRKEVLEIFDRTFLLTYVLEAIAVIIAMLGIVNTLVTSVLERRREFSTLQAVGAEEKQIRQLVLWEATYLGIVGIGLGLIGGGALAMLLIKVINKQSFGWTIQMIIPWGGIAQAVILAMIATLVAGYVPSRWAAKQSVVEGLREE
ncbi:MAG: ABC transporter permease [Nitrospira sp.]|nr:ABC transporter permease [Nitrospira sp.]